MDSLTVRNYCQCGAKLDVTSSPPEMAREVARLFAEVHRGLGHGGATPEQARKARERQRKEYT
jgi:hypothetical protein